MNTACAYVATHFDWKFCTSFSIIVLTLIVSFPLIFPSCSFPFVYFLLQNRLNVDGLRHLMENLFARLKHFRAVALDETFHASPSSSSNKCSSGSRTSIISLWTIFSLWRSYSYTETSISRMDFSWLLPSSLYSKMSNLLIKCHLLPNTLFDSYSTTCFNITANVIHWSNYNRNKSRVIVAILK